MTENFAFADRLKSEFSGRGVAASASRQTGAATGNRPATGSRPAAGSRPANEGARNAPSRPSYGQPGPSAADRNAGSRRTAGGEVPDASRPGYRNMNVRHSVSEDIAGRGRARRQNAGGQAPAGSSGAGRYGEAGKTSRTAPKQKSGQKIRVKQTRAAKKRKAAERGEQEEYKLRRMAPPVALIAVTLVAVLIIFTLVESLAEVYQTATEIARMKAQRDELKDVAAALELKLDEKNDVRTIREIAVGELGMADEDSMQRRFISVSGGERIELLETEEDAEQAGGVLFSSLGEFINRFLGRFR